MGMDNGNININFDLRTIGEWRALLAQTGRATWMQTLAYASAALKVDQRKTHFATLEIEGNVLGLVAIQELKLGPVHFVSIYRGPLWFKGQETLSNIKKFTEALHKKYPKRWLRRIRWMPEWNSKSNSLAFIEESGLRKAEQYFHTLWIDLTPELSIIKSRLDQKWRNCLNKSERSDLQITADATGRNLDQFIKAYEIFKHQKSFTGPSGKFFKNEIESALPFKDAILLWAKIGGIPVAGILIMKHGTTASYRMGWNTANGRQVNAHYLLIWKAIEVLKKFNISFLDVGGILPDEKDGLTHFKKGLNGELFSTEIYR